MLWFCRKLNKIIQQFCWCCYKSFVTCCYKLSIIFNNFKNKRCIFCGSILTPNTRNLSLIILHLKPKVVNVLTKTWVKLVFYKKGLAKFFLYRNIFANSCIKNAQFNIFYQYMLLLTKVKQFSNLLKIKKK